jgi:hypothetical protein
VRITPRIMQNGTQRARRGGGGGACISLRGWLARLCVRAWKPRLEAVSSNHPAKTKSDRAEFCLNMYFSTTIQVSFPSSPSFEVKKRFTVSSEKKAATSKHFEMRILDRDFELEEIPLFAHDLHVCAKPHRPQPPRVAVCAVRSVPFCDRPPNQCNKHLAASRATARGPVSGAP